MRAVAIGEAMIEMAPASGGLFRRGFAGDTFNTAWHMRQLLNDATKVGFLTRVGRDSLSDAFLTELEQDGLDTSIVGRDDKRVMGLYMIELDGVERRFHYWRGQSAARGLADDPAILFKSLEGAGLIHLSGITLAILSAQAREALFAALSELRRQGAIISFDPNFRPRLWGSMQEARDAVSKTLSLTDIALPSFDDERHLWGDQNPAATIDRISSTGVAEIVVKNGPDAIQFKSGGELGTVKTAPVPGTKDTTGAGDAYNAGHLSARMSGSPVARAIHVGQQLAGLVLQHYGARAPQDEVTRLAANLVHGGA